MSERRRRGHEPSAIAVQRIALFALLLIAIIMASLVTVRLSVRSLRSAQGNARDATPLRLAPPQLQAYPAQDLAAYAEEKQQRLHSYGWIDRDAGVARIPIERAMHILAERSKQSDAPSDAAHEANP